MATAQTPVESRILSMQSAGIGLKRGRVELALHNPKWRRCFSNEAYSIFDALKIEGLRLFHIGSTSVPGISAKPVIDILGSVQSLDLLDVAQSQLQNLGYQYKGEYGISGRRYCTLYNAEATTAYVHIHFFEHTNPAVRSHILFRDYLRANPEIARAYSEMKNDLVTGEVARLDYSDRKSPMIARISADSEVWDSNPKFVLKILGTALDGSHTKQLLESSDLLGAKTKIINLSELAISNYLYDSSQYRADDFLKTARQMTEADVIVFATPVYWYSMAGVMKTFFDRFSDLLSGEHKSLGDSLYGKKMKLVATGYDETLPLGFEVPFAATAIYFGMDYLGANYESFR